MISRTVFSIKSPRKGTCGHAALFRDILYDEDNQIYIEGGLYDIEYLEVRLIHQSAKDYLLRKNKDSNPVLEDFDIFCWCQGLMEHFRIDLCDAYGSHSMAASYNLFYF